MRNCAFCFVGEILDGKCQRCGTMHEDTYLLERELQLKPFEELVVSAQEARREAFEVEFKLRKKVVKLERRDS